MRQSGRKLSFQRVARQQAEPRVGISEAQMQALRPDSPAPAARSGQARAHRKPRAWLARAEGKFQSPEAGPGGHHSVFSLGLLKQTTTKNPH